MVEMTRGGRKEQEQGVIILLQERSTSGAAAAASSAVPAPTPRVTFAGEQPGWWARRAHVGRERDVVYRKAKNHVVPAARKLPIRA